MKSIILGVLTALVINNLIQYKVYSNTTQSYSNKSPGKPSTVPNITPKHTEKTTKKGSASFYTNEYCRKYNPKCQTASGEVFDDSKFTAACSSIFNLGQKLRVKYKNEVVEVTCNDRGSFERSYGRILDLSKASFEALAPLSKGVISVTVEKI